MIPCPNEDQLVRFVDGALSLDETERLSEHLASCAVCRRRDEAFRTFVADAFDDEDLGVDLDTHVRLVMDRLGADRSTDAPRPRAPSMGPLASAASPLACAMCRLAWAVSRFSFTMRRLASAVPTWGWGLPVAALACAVPLAHHLLHSRAASDERSAEASKAVWQARGAHVVPTLGRDVGVQPYAVRNGLEPLGSGAVVEGSTPVTAGFRNIGRRPAFLLLFVVDARGAVHWISPPFVSPQDDPVSTTLGQTADERVLGTTAVFDDLIAGPLRVVAVITPAPAHVSDVEALGADITADRIARRLPGAEVRETLLEVRDKGATP